jgi:hypothetical protein
MATATMRTNDRWVPRAGFALGLAASAALVTAARLPAQPRALGLDLTVVAEQATGLTLKPGGILLNAAGLRAGGSRSAATGRSTLINPTARTERVRVRAIPSSRALDSALQIEVRLAGVPLYRGPLGGLRGGSARVVPLQSGDGRPLVVHVWLPAGASGWRGRIEDLDLSFETTPAASR